MDEGSPISADRTQDEGRIVRTGNQVEKDLEKNFVYPQRLPGYNERQKEIAYEHSRCALRRRIRESTWSGPRSGR